MTGQTSIETGTASAARAGNGSVIFAALSVPHYPRLWTMGLLWNLTRWMSVFLSSYLANQLSHSPLLVSAVGAAFFAPMFLGGALAGAISDRLDRRRTMLCLLLFLVPVAGVMAAVNMAGVVRIWMIYPFMVAIGISMVVDMTSRRALVYDVVGAQHITNAVALESMATTSGSMLGTLSAGTIISVLGIGQAFALISVLYAVSFAVLLGLPKIRPLDARTGKTGLLDDLRAGFRYLHGHRTLISILGITIVMNCFYFSFTPMVPVFADHLGVNAFWTGILASAAAFGSMIGTLLIARGLPFPRGRAYVGGTMVGMAFLVVFATAGWYPLALAALICAGVGMAGFSTMQSALVMLAAEDEMRGRAMGLLSMGIGVLPFSMLLLGGVAQVIGPSTAVASSALIGLVLTLSWAFWRPEAQRIA